MLLSNSGEFARLSFWKRQFESAWEYMRELEFAELNIGLLVFDGEDKGKIIECNDIHNVEVEFNGESGEDSDGYGHGLFCLDKTCEHYSPLYDRPFV